ncbi:MAG: cytochrome c4 [Proteobacteria bacterium]|nr:cytochrome c4 [Pseudomonadota bacterium]
MIRNWLVAAVFAWPALVSAQAAAPAKPAEAAAPAAEAPKAAAPAPDAAKIVSTVCAACHGSDGHSVASSNPNLAGLPAAYIALQLAHFKSGVRPGSVMPGFAATLSPADMEALGEYFSKQKPKPGTARDPALVQAGQKIFRAGIPATGVPACAACHSPDGAGIPKNFPRVGGQWADYTYAQLKAFAGGQRGSDPKGVDVNGHIMAVIAAKLTDAQMRAVAEYMQGLR